MNLKEYSLRQKPHFLGKLIYGKEKWIMLMGENSDFLYVVALFKL